MEQNTNQWLEWRRGGIGSSDAPIIMGVSPYRTPYQLWEEKLGLADYSGGNEFIKQKGHTYETRARNMYCLESGLEVKPLLVQSEDFPMLRASLDGWSQEKKIIVEFKFVGERVFESDDIVEHHWPQLQHQMMITDAVELHYVKYSEPQDKIKIKIVKPDPLYHEKLLGEELSFWGKVRSRTPPPLTERDYVRVSDQDLSILVERWSQSRSLLEVVAREEEGLRKKILEASVFSQHRRLRINNVKIVKSTRKGSVDYSKIPELAGVDLERYRKPPTEYWIFCKGQ